MERRIHSWENKTSKGTNAGIWIAVIIIIAVVGIGISSGWFDGSNTDVVASVAGYDSCMVFSTELDKILDKVVAMTDSVNSKITEIEKANPGKQTRRVTKKEKKNYDAIISKIAVVKVRYDSINTEYVSIMERFNWRFTNADSLPPGKTKILKRYPTFLPKLEPGMKGMKIEPGPITMIVL